MRSVLLMVTQRDSWHHNLPLQSILEAVGRVVDEARSRRSFQAPVLVETKEPLIEAAGRLHQRADLGIEQRDLPRIDAGHLEREADVAAQLELGDLTHEIGPVIERP